MENKTADRHYYGGKGAPIWGIFLLFLGIVLLLQSFGVLPWDLWGTLIRFWPALIIIIGLAILLRHTNIWLVSVITVIILGGSLGIAIWQNGISQSGIITENYAEPLSDLEQAQVNIDFSSGKLNITSLPDESIQFFEAEAEAKNDISSLHEDFNQEGNSGFLSLNSINQQYWPTTGITWYTDFTTGIPISFDIKSTASTNKLDLKDLNLSDFSLDTNASSSTINLPGPTGMLPITISANAASIEITLPADAAVRVHATTTVGTFNINSRFTKDGEFYVTDNYDGASDRIEMDINSNVSSIKVN